MKIFILRKGSKLFVLFVLTLIFCISTEPVLAKNPYNHDFEGYVKVGDFNLYVNVTGKKKPVVLFESGYGDTHEIWSAVQDEISKKYRTVSYDRAGVGKSEKSSKRRTSLNQVHELHAALEEVNMKGPYIIVAHSAGGFNARLFASEYPKEVAGILFVDSSSDTQVERDLEFIDKYIPDIKGLYLSQFCVEGTLDDILESEAQVRETRRFLKNIPITVLSATHHSMPAQVEKAYEEMIMGLQKELAALSDDSRHIVIDTGHNIHYDKPCIVSEEIIKLISRIDDKSHCIFHWYEYLESIIPIWFREFLFHLD